MKKQCDAYSIDSYDLVYILLKDSILNKDYLKEVIHHDKKRNRYYLVGIVVKLGDFPKPNMLAFVDQRNITLFRKLNTMKEKIKLVHNVQFLDIDYINLSFDSLDWK